MYIKCDLEVSFSISPCAQGMHEIPKHLNTGISVAFRSSIPKNKEVLAINRLFSLVDTITNTKFSNCPTDFKIGVVWQ